jgi:hypothetical protein
MASYVTVENQTILWSTIQKVQLLHDQIPAHQQQEWFKNIVGMFYQKIQHTQYDLRQINKETIAYMISNIKSEPQQPVKSDFQQSEILELRLAIRELQEDVARLKLRIPEPKEVTE